MQTPDLHQFHPFAANFEMMNGADFSRLVDDVKVNGLHEPITLYQGKVLDGRNRYSACLRAKVKHRFEPFVGDDAAALTFVFTKNLHRRHLTPKEKRDAIALWIKKNPNKSDRAIAADLKVDKNVVSRARKKVEATGAGAPVEKRTGKDGKSRRMPTKTQPAKPEMSKTAATAAASQTMPGDIEPMVSDPPKQETNCGSVHCADHRHRLAMENLGLKDEIAQLTAENAKLREQLEAACAPVRARITENFELERTHPSN
jgi:hypothetical protein